MRHDKPKKFIRTVIISLSIILSSLSFAHQVTNDTIISTVVPWDDIASRTLLLETVAKWHDDVMQSLFDAYRHPERYQLASIKNEKQYNVQFIHAFWGPVNNPFNKYPRPAKAFVFLNNEGNNETDIFYMAPLLKI